MKHGLSRIARFRRGASVLIAILVFFLAALSGTLVLTMAASNAGRYTHEKEDQQAYFSVASAVKLILSKLRQAEVHFKSTQQRAVPKGTDEIDIENTDLADLGLFFADHTFEDSVLKQFALREGEVFLQAEFNLTVNGHDEMGTVHVILLVQGGEFFFQFYVVNGESKNYQMTMRVAATFGKEGAGNWIQDDDGYYKRTLKFDVDNVTFINELLTGDLET